MHGGEGVFPADVEVGLAGRFIQHMGRAAGMKLDCSREEIGILRNDVAILADAGHRALEFQVPQQVTQLAALIRRQVEGLGDLGFIESPGREKFENSGAKIVFIAAFARRSFMPGHTLPSSKALPSCKKMLAPASGWFHLSLHFYS